MESNTSFQERMMSYGQFEDSEEEREPSMFSSDLLLSSSNILAVDMPAFDLESCLEMRDLSFSDRGKLPSSKAKRAWEILVASDLPRSSISVCRLTAGLNLPGVAPSVVRRALARLSDFQAQKS